MNHIKKILAGYRENDAGIINACAFADLSSAMKNSGAYDFFTIYNTSKYGAGKKALLSCLMPYDNFNQSTIDIGNDAGDFLVKHPVFAAVCGTDPFRNMKLFLTEIRSFGFMGIHNFPSVGIFFGGFRDNLEKANLGYDLEVEMVYQANHIGLLTAVNIFDLSQAKKMVKAGADIIIINQQLVLKHELELNISEHRQWLDQLIYDICKNMRNEKEETIILLQSLRENKIKPDTLRNIKELDGIFDVIY